MSTATAPPPKLNSPVTAKVRWILLAIFVLVGIFLGVLAVKWPYTKKAMIERLERASSAHVEILEFRSTYFPYPGCVAGDVTFHVNLPDGKPAQQPIITIRRLKIESTLMGMLSKPGRIKKMIADGVRIHVPAEGANLHSREGTERVQLVIEELKAKDAVLEIVNGKGEQKPLVFPIHQVTFHNVNARNTIPFEVSFHLPLPPGEVESYGWIGPWDENKTMRNTPVSGSYALKQADLGFVSSLGGMLSSQGSFSGDLSHLDVKGNAESADFMVKESGHRFRVSTKFQGDVDLKTGDVTLPTLKANLGNTTLDAEATIAGRPKTVSLNVTEGKGTVQDLILLFSDAPQSPIVGPIIFHAKAVLPSEDRPFKERVRLNGDYKIDPARFTAPKTQENVDELSERAQGEKDKKDRDSDDDTKGFDRVLTNLTGQVALTNGTAVLPRTTFSVPGAKGEMAGTYNLLNKKVNFHGKMQMRATVSQATTGIKSFLLKVVDPFYKKKHAGADVPISMTGTYGHVHFAAGLK